MEAGPHSRDVKLAMDVLQADLARPWKIDDLASFCGVARRTLEKHFRQFIGCTPAEFLQTERMKHARRTLLKALPGANVTAIAGESGFTHLGRFSLAYRKRYGESPSRTLKSCRNILSIQSAGTHHVSAVFDRPTLSISPFQVVGFDAVHMAGAVEDIAAALLRTGWINVVSDTKGQYDLSGSIREDGVGGTTVRTALFDRATARMLWANRWSYSSASPAGFQQWLAEQITSILRCVLRTTEIDRASRTGLTPPTSWSLCMRALPMVLAADPVNHEIAADLLDRAIELAPQDPIPTSLSGWCHGLRAAHHFTPQPDIERKAAYALAQTASALGSSDPCADTMLSAAYMLTHDLAAAEMHARRALAVDGGSAWAWGRVAWVHAYRGQAPATIEHCLIAGLSRPRTR